LQNGAGAALAASITPELAASCGSLPRQHRLRIGWVHNECVGLESDAEDYDVFLCPDCDE